MGYDFFVDVLSLGELGIEEGVEGGKVLEGDVFAFEEAAVRFRFGKHSSIFYFRNVILF